MTSEDIKHQLIIIIIVTDIALLVSEGQSHKTASPDHKLFELRERRAGSESNCGPSASGFSGQCLAVFTAIMS